MLPRLALAVVAAALVPFASATPILDNDAGSGRDAPNTRSGLVWIALGETYLATLSGPTGDGEDWFAFTGAAGATVSAAILAGTLSFEITKENGAHLFGGTAILGSQSGAASFTLPTAGTYYFHTLGGVPQGYQFRIA